MLFLPKVGEGQASKFPGFLKESQGKPAIELARRSILVQGRAHMV